MPPLSTGASDASNLNQINNTMRDIKQKQITDIRKDDTGTRRILFGKGADGFYGLKVSPEGVDVYTATDGQLIFNSNQNVFKILQEGDITVTQRTIPDGGVGGFGNLNTNVGSYAHNLGFKPAVMGFMEFSTGIRVQLPYVSNEAFSTTTASWTSYTLNVTDTNLLVGVRGMSYGGAVGTFNATVHYYLLQETAD